MAAIFQDKIIDIKFRFGTAVVACANYTTSIGPRIVKSSNGISWQNVTTGSGGEFLEVCLSDWATLDSFTIFLPFSGNTYGSDFLKDITGLASISNVTAGGSRAWQCVDIDNFFGANQYILAGTSSGLYRSNDGGATFTSL